MARKTLDYIISLEGRDKGKTFRITEMPASQAESWAFRALLAIMHSTHDIPNMPVFSMEALVRIGLQGLSGVSWEVAGPLLDEMMSCIQIIPNPATPLIMRPLLEEDIEEISTRLELRKAIWGLHTDFFSAASPGPAFAAKKEGR